MGLTFHSKLLPLRNSSYSGDFEPAISYPDWNRNLLLLGSSMQSKFLKFSKFNSDRRFYCSRYMVADI